MISTLILSDRRVARLTRLTSAAVAAVALTACDSDDAIGPKSAQVPTAAQSAVIGLNPRVVTGVMRQSFVDVVGPIGGMSLKLRDSTGATIAEFREGSNAPDIDPAPGKLELKLAEGEYSICYMAAPFGYTLIIPQGQCIWFHTKRDSIAELPPITSYPNYSVYWMVHNGVGGPDFNLNPVGPSTFMVKDLVSGQTMTVVDNGANDFDPRLGLFAVKLAGASDYEICQTQAPAGHYNALPSCMQATVVAATPKWAGWIFNQKKETGIGRAQ